MRSHPVSTADILKGLEFEAPSGSGEMPELITAVTSDSRSVHQGGAFVALRGGSPTSKDGHEFIATADAAGAALIVGEDPAPAGLRAVYLRVKDSRFAIARMACAFYGNPSRSMIIVGVTGTSGKTTTTYLIESILKASHLSPALIGTVLCRIDGHERPSTHTTPFAHELQTILAEARDAGCKAVVMEVSSHALKQARTAGIAFDAVAYTNLSPEHLDFHPDMEDYFQTKARLFKEYAKYAAEGGKSIFGAVNVDDEYGLRLEKESEIPVVRYGLDKFAEVSGSLLAHDVNGIRGSVGDVRVDSHLAGKFNVSNILAAIAVAKGLKIDSVSIAWGITATVVPGRLERVPNQAGIHVLVDYAHKSDALEKVLKALQDSRQGHRLITVFGCGGDRDRTKRPVMARIAAEFSDLVWVTSDNPRTENPDAIIEEILKGIPSSMARGTDFEVEPDRRKAIFGAIHGARPGDVVLIAGKGHEDYQIVAAPAQPGQPITTHKIHFDDREVATDALAQLKNRA